MARLPYAPRAGRRPAPVALLACLAGGLSLASCRDLSGFSTAHGGSYEGSIIGADFIRAGVPATTDGGAPNRMCLTLDTDHLQDTPGALSTTDGMFRAAPMRTVPQIWHDPLSTLSFGEGRLKNLIYVVTASAPLADGGTEVFAVVSLMQSGDVEVRLLHGAPRMLQDAAAPMPNGGNLFAVFTLQRDSKKPCSY
jgi:hypothetical protein